MLDDYLELRDTLRRMLELLDDQQWEAYDQADQERTLVFSRLPQTPPAQARPLLEEIAALAEALEKGLSLAHQQMAQELKQVRRRARTDQAYNVGAVDQRSSWQA